MQSCICSCAPYCSVRTEIPDAPRLVVRKTTARLQLKGHMPRNEPHRRKIDISARRQQQLGIAE